MAAAAVEPRRANRRGPQDLKIEAVLVDQMGTPENPE